MPDRIKVYLAGPITGCSNADQKVKWRQRMKALLREAGFQPLDPTDEKARKGPLSVSADIEEADVVVANMWRESVGTVLGIVHAQRLGIPVVLIDQHYLNNPILESLADETVRDEKAAVNVLRNKIESALRPQIKVTKKLKTGKVASDDFSARKLQRSLKSSCTMAGIDDAVFCTLLLRRVRRGIVESSVKGEISSGEIKQLIFTELDRLASDDSQLTGDDSRRMRENAASMRDRWEEYDVFMKEGQREQDQRIGEYEAEIDELSAQLIRANILAGSEPKTNSEAAVESTRIALGMAAKLQHVLKGKKALCICRVGTSTFRAAFGRLGLGGEDFDRFFEERLMDGKQSNLNSDIKSWINSYSYVLYAGKALRHISDQKVKDAPNFVRGFAPINAIKRLLPA